MSVPAVLQSRGMVRHGSSVDPSGASPTQEGAGTPGSRPTLHDAYEQLYAEVLEGPSSALPRGSRFVPPRRKAGSSPPVWSSAASGRKVRVVQLIPSLGVGGAERMMVSLATGLDKDRYDVKVLTFFDSEGTSVDDALSANGIEVVTLGKKVGFDPLMFPRVAIALRGLDPDIVHTHRPVFPYVLPSILGYLRGRVVHTVHSVAAKEVEDRLRRSSHWLAFRIGVASVAICDFVAMSIIEVHGVAPRAIIPNGVPVKAFAVSRGARERWRADHGIPAEDVVFACVARLAPPKNHEALLKAFAALGDLTNAQLLIVGDGPLRAELEARIQALGISSRVRITGSRTDIPEVLAASDVFVLPSLYEGSPLSVMEAMAARRPVIATSVGGIPELVNSGETGLLVPPFNVTELARALRRLHADPGLRARFGAAAGRQAAQAFDISHMVGAYDRLYQEILAQSGAGAATLST